VTTSPAKANLEDCSHGIAVFRDVNGVLKSCMLELDHPAVLSWVKRRAENGSLIELIPYDDEGNTDA
jgi:hypothetical protein